MYYAIIDVCHIITLLNLDIKQIIGGSGEY